MISRETLDNGLNRFENALSCAAAFPGVGAVPATAKAALGIGQSVAAVAYGIFANIHNRFSEDRLSTRHAWTYLKHGAGNIGASIIEGTPLVGTIALVVRIVRDCKNKGFKFMPYPTLKEYRVSYNDLNNALSGDGAPISFEDEIGSEPLSMEK